MDAFDATQRSSPRSQPEFVAALQRVLTPGGAVAVNVIGALAPQQGADPVREIAQALSARLQNTRIVPVMTTDEAYAAEALRNVVVIAARG